MGKNFAAIAFTDRVKAEQERIGSRTAYARVESAGPDDSRLTPIEAAFIAGRESFYMASVSATGWPYIQHRGGPRGFIQAVDEKTLGFCDFRGNKQLISVGNFAENDRVALFFMDYANSRRLKMLGRVRTIDAAEHPDLVKALTHPDYRGRPERIMLIDVAGYDWNCPQHIPQLFSMHDLQIMQEASMNAASASE